MLISEEVIRLKFRNKVYLPLTYKIRKRRLNTEEFTIISNNCWGGTVYESYGIQKKSPTIGMFIMPEDYLRFVTEFEYYIKQPLVFIKPEESKWKSVLENKKNWMTYPIAKLDDVELHLLHYHDEESVRKKWNARLKRINRDKIIFKFNDQNNCTINLIEHFMELPLKNKLCFVADEALKVNDNVIVIKQPGKYKEGVKASREPFGFSKYIDITAYINNL